MLDRFPKGNTIALLSFRGLTACSNVILAQAGIHWFTVVGRPNHLRKRTSSRSGFLLPQE
jgi:hypothetical protein